MLKLATSPGGVSMSLLGNSGDAIHLRFRDSLELAATTRRVVGRTRTIILRSLRIVPLEEENGMYSVRNLLSDISKRVSIVSPVSSPLSSSYAPNFTCYGLSALSPI